MSVIQLITFLMVSVQCGNKVVTVEIRSTISAVFDLESFGGLHGVIISDSATSSDCFSTFLSCNAFSYPSPSNVARLKERTGWQSNTVVFSLFSRLDLAAVFMIEIETLLKQLRWTDWSPYIFVLLESVNNSLELPQCSFKINSSVYVVSLRTLNTSLSAVRIEKIREVYSLKGNDMSQDIEIAPSKSSPQRISLWHILPQVQRRSNFRKVDIVGIHVDNPVYVHSIRYKPSNNGSKVEFAGGFVVHEYWYLRDALNFTEKATNWSTYLKLAKNGSLTGLAVPINYGLADICIGSNEFLEYRVTAPNAITFLQPTFHNKMLIFLRQPTASSARDIYLTAFTSTAWILVGLTWLLVSTSLRICTLVLRKINSFRALPDKPADAVVETEAWIWGVATLCQKGWHITPSSMSSRIIFLCGFVSGLLLYTAYCASLVSILSVEVTPVRRVEDLVTYHYRLFSDDHVPTTTLVVKHYQVIGIIPKSPSGNDDSDLEISTNLTRIVKTHTAVISTPDSFYQAVLKDYDERFACVKFSSFSFSRRPVLSSMFVKRGSPLREYFNYKIIQMRERGVLFRLREHFIENTSVRCVSTDTDFDQQLSPKDVITAFVLLAIGFASSGAVLAMERLVFRVSLLRKDSAPPFVSPVATIGTVNSSKWANSASIGTADTKKHWILPNFSKRFY